eukprot:6196865-Pleurochrysis_carterae.AAC.1
MRFVALAPIFTLEMDSTRVALSWGVAGIDRTEVGAADPDVRAGTPIWSRGALRTCVRCSAVAGEGPFALLRSWRKLYARFRTHAHTRAHSLSLSLLVAAAAT